MFQPQRFGINLAGPSPTPEEKQQLEEEIRTRPGIFRQRVLHAWAPINQRKIYRLDAIELEPEGAQP